MLIPKVKITITQVPTTDFSGRNKIVYLDFVASGDIESTWEDLTDTGKITIPKNIYFIDGDGKKMTWQGKSIISETGTEPIITRGDKISIKCGYIYPSQDVAGEFVEQYGDEFSGYITKISNRIPLEITYEDAMFDMKNTHIVDKVYLESAYSVETMMQDIIAQVNAARGTNYTIKVDNIITNVGDYRCVNVSAAEVLDELRKTYHIVAFFRGTELRIGYIRYYPQDKIQHIFHFQKNVIDDNLEYMRKDEIRIGIKAYSINQIEVATAGTNKDGTQKTKQERLEANVGDADGEIRTLYFYNVTSVAALEKLAAAKLQYLKIDGCTGDFTTFGLPFVKHGDSVLFYDDVIPERNNNEYYVKQVKTTFGVDGIRQIITIDLRIDTLTLAQINAYQSNGGI